MMKNATGIKTVDETAEELKVSSKTIRRWIKKGSLPVIKLGPRNIFTTAEDRDRMKLLIKIQASVGKQETKKEETPHKHALHR